MCVRKVSRPMTFLASLMLAGCASPTSRPVVVSGPTVIVFSPAATDAQLATDDGLASSLDHLGKALGQTEQCLAGSPVTALMFRGNRLSVETSRGVDAFDLSASDNSSIGCYLSAPGKASRTIFASAGASSLIVLCPAAAAAYFGIPACCPNGFTCCEDGEVVDEASRCDR